MSLTKAILIEAIKSLPDDAPVVINGELVNGVEIVQGRINAEDGYFSKRFSRTPKGKTKGIVFTRWTELSNGEITSDSII